jgi:hypothetical protein
MFSLANSPVAQLDKEEFVDSLVHLGVPQLIFIRESPRALLRSVAARQSRLSFAAGGGTRYSVRSAYKPPLHDSGPLGQRGGRYESHHLPDVGSPTGDGDRWTDLVRSA